MNTQIRLVAKQNAPDSIEYIDFSATLTTEGVVVDVDGPYLSRTVEWDKLEDVEHMANLFWDYQVWQFREVVKLLAQARQCQHLAV